MNETLANNEDDVRKDAEAYIYEVTKLLDTLNALMDLRALGPCVGEGPSALLEATSSTLSRVNKSGRIGL